MTKPFLQQLAHYLDESGRLQDNSLIILPNRRSLLFLRHHLAAIVSRTTWLPAMMSISDYVDQRSPLNRADPLDTLFSLYACYTSLVQEAESLDEFYHWGEIMLSDFDELDKYRVDVDMLFRNLSDLKELEDPVAGLDEEHLRFIRQFWEGFSAGAGSEEKRRFLEIWKLLPRLYHALRARLLEKGEAYAGMQYRDLLDQLQLPEQEGQRDEKIMFVGFNALNACEIELFNHHKNRGAEFYWDHNPAYMDDPVNEAGRFMRENLRRFPPPDQWLDFEAGCKAGSGPRIRIFDLPTDLLQAKMLPRLLEEDNEARGADCTDTAIILCDEHLLVPALLALPEEAGELNITMGYPMASTPLEGFISGLFRLYSNARSSEDGELNFYHKDVQALLIHPFMTAGREGGRHQLLDQMSRENMVRIGASFISGGLEELVFRHPRDPEDLFRVLGSIMQTLLSRLDREGDRVLPILQREFILRFLSALNLLENRLASWSDYSSEFVQRLIRKMLSSIRIPFEGEPLSGLQLMGILESRLLDFRHVILLSMNEDIMPAAHSGQSYIPYSMRLAFGMPGKEDMDAIYAYYFSRLLQRAEKVDLVFNSTSEGVRTGEMSRYLQALIFEKDLDVLRPGLDVSARSRMPVQGLHAGVEGGLRSFLAESGSDKYLSPSAINTYISCPLKFYLRYLCGISEVDEVSEDIDAADFGTVVHDSMQRLYNEIKDSEGRITAEGLGGLLDGSRPSLVLREEFVRTHYRRPLKGEMQGRNRIVIRVMEAYLKQIIRTDLKIAPFTLLSTEEKWLREIRVEDEERVLNIRIGGKIDRVDRAGEAIRVIDYKTGQASTSVSSLEGLFMGETGNRNGAALQTMLYAWLLRPAYPEEAVSPGLYVMKSLYEKDFDPVLSLGSGKDKQPLTSFSEIEEDFIAELEAVLREIFDPSIPFAQTPNEKNCRYCDFQTFCGRSDID